MNPCTSVLGSAKAHPKETMRRDGKLWHLEDTVSKADAVVWGGGIIRVVKENKRKDEEEWIEVIEKHQQKYDK